jgi:hypothetical protein
MDPSVKAALETIRDRMKLRTAAEKRVVISPPDSDQDFDQDNSILDTSDVFEFVHQTKTKRPPFNMSASAPEPVSQADTVVDESTQVPTSGGSRRKTSTADDLNTKYGFKTTDNIYRCCSNNGGRICNAQLTDPRNFLEHLATAHLGNRLAQQTLERMGVYRCEECKDLMQEEHATRHNNLCRGAPRRKLPVVSTKPAKPAGPAAPPAPSKPAKPAVPVNGALDAPDPPNPGGPPEAPRRAPAPERLLSRNLDDLDFDEVIRVLEPMTTLPLKLVCYPYHNHTPINNNNLYIAEQLHLTRIFRMYNRVFDQPIGPTYTHAMRGQVQENAFKAVIASISVLHRVSNATATYHCLNLLSSDPAAWFKWVADEINDMANNVNAKLADINDTNNNNLHPDDPANADNFDRLRKRIAHLIAVGNISKAGRAASSDTTIQLFNAVIQEAARAKLNAAGPQDELTIDHGASSGQAEYAEFMNRITDSDIRAAANNMAKGAALGADNFTPEFIALMVNQVNPTAAEVFTTFIKNIMAGNVAFDARRYLNGGALICLPKENGDIRPIVPQSGLGKLIEKLLFNHVKHAASKIGNQYGIGYKDGVTKAIKTCTADLLSNPNKVMLQLDVANAYPSISRAAVYDALRADPAFRVIAPWFRSIYAQELHITARSPTGITTVPSSTGVLQGSVLAPLLFSVATSAAVKAAADCLRVTVAAYIDDITIVGLPDDVERAANEFASKLGPLGLSLNLGKSTLVPSTLVFPVNATPQDAPASIQLLGRPIAPVQTGTILLGTPLGSLEFVEESFAKTLADEVAILHKFAQRVPHLQSRFALTRMTRTAAFQHLARSCPAHYLNLLQQYMGLHDDEMLKAVLAITTGQVGDYKEMAALPTHTCYDRVILTMGHGGLALGASTVHLQAMALGSHHNWLADPCSSKLRFAHDPNEGIWEDRMAHFKDVFGPHLKTEDEAPTNLRELRGLQMAKTQAAFSHAINDKLFANYRVMVDLMPETQKTPILAHLNSLEQEGATLAIRALPVNLRTTFTNIEFAALLQIHMDLELPSTIPRPAENVTCCGGNVLTIQHAIGCFAEEAPRTTRHNDVVHLIGEACRGARLRFVFEPRFTGDGQGADFAVSINNVMTVGDVAVITPYRLSELKHSATKFGGVIAETERIKNGKYLQRYNNAGAAFLPIVYEVTGAMGEGAIDFWKRFSKHVTNNAPLCLFPRNFVTPSYVAYHKTVVAINIAKVIIKTMFDCVSRRRQPVAY